jgi:hypothetical protein
VTSSGSKKPPTAAAQRLAAKQAAAAQARAAAAARRSRLTRVGVPVSVVLLVLIVIVVAKVVTGNTSNKSGAADSQAPTGVIAEVTSVPLSVFNTVGAGTISTPPAASSEPALTADGKPRVLYVGAEYCPYCATERWAVAVALSRFGTFSGLGQTQSSPSDVYPSTNTLSFHGATFTSTYLSFTGKEIQSNQVDSSGGYAPLDTLSAADEALVQKYDTGGGIPFVDIGGKYVISGASYNPQVLQGKTHAQIAAALSQPNTAIAKGAIGTANVITAALCSITDNKPAAVCTSAGVLAGAKKLSSG